MVHDLFDNIDMLALIKMPAVNQKTYEVNKRLKYKNKELLTVFIENIKFLYEEELEKVAETPIWDDEDWAYVLPDYNDPRYKLRYSYTFSELVNWKNIGTYNEIRIGDLKLYSIFIDINLLLEMIEDNLHVTGNLDLRNNYMPILHENFINKFTIGETLNLRETSLEILPNNFGEINIGNNIDLSWNYIVNLPGSIKDLKINGYLDLSNNWIVVLSETFSGIKTNYLNLSYNKIERLPNSFWNINLRMLDLRHNYLKNLPEIFSQFKINLLDLSNNLLEELPNSFWNINVDSLYLSNNHLKEIPEIYSELNIGDLNLSNNQLEKLPNSFWNINVYDVLDLSYNKLKELPEIYSELNIGDLN